jgi:hypothetical protein
VRNRDNNTFKLAIQLKLIKTISSRRPYSFFTFLQAYLLITPRSSNLRALKMFASNMPNQFMQSLKEANQCWTVNHVGSLDGFDEQND